MCGLFSSKQNALLEPRRYPDFQLPLKVYALCSWSTVFLLPELMPAIICTSTSPQLLSGGSALFLGRKLLCPLWGLYSSPSLRQHNCRLCCVLPRRSELDRQQIKDSLKCYARHAGLRGLGIWFYLLFDFIIKNENKVNVFKANRLKPNSNLFTCISLYCDWNVSKYTRHHWEDWRDCTA